MQKIKTPWPSGILFKKLSDKEFLLQMKIIKDKQKAGSTWVFAFGSLMWNPCFKFDRKEPAYLNGWERRFHIWTTIARGTPERPGLGLCLEKGKNGTKGLAFRLIENNLDNDWRAIWEREMISGVYRAKWLNILLDTGEPISALTFIVNPLHRQYAGSFPLMKTAEIIAGASGKFGTCRDYLANTVLEIKKIDAKDKYLNNLLNAVDLIVSTQS